MAAKMAIGVLTPRHQRHDVYSVRTPPTIKPIAAPPPEIAPKTPNAFARSFGTVNVTEMIARAAGARSAPKTPCSARDAKSRPCVDAIPPSADAPANPRSPMMKIFLRPMKSPIRPPSSSSEPNANVYAVIIHC